MANQRIYARVDGGAVMEMFATTGDITTMFHPSLTWVEITSISPQPQVGWSYAAGVFSAPSAPAAQVLWSQYQSKAQYALAESDVTVLRCYENTVAVPAAWGAYRKALRAIIGAASGDPTQPLPTRPAYPAGT
jgi:hypothetical protein